MCCACTAIPIEVHRQTANLSIALTSFWACSVGTRCGTLLPFVPCDAAHLWLLQSGYSKRFRFRAVCSVKVSNINLRTFYEFSFLSFLLWHVESGCTVALWEEPRCSLLCNVINLLYDQLPSHFPRLSSPSPLHINCSTVLRLPPTSCPPTRTLRPRLSATRVAIKHAEKPSK